MYRLQRYLLAFMHETSVLTSWGGFRRNLPVHSEFTFPRTVGMKNLTFWRSAAIVFHHRCRVPLRFRCRRKWSH